MNRFVRHASYIITAIACSFVLSSCAKSPKTLLSERYDNMNEDRVIETAYENESTVVLYGKKEGEKCNQVETVMYTKMNQEKEWRIFRAQNSRNCKSDRENEVRERYLEWVKIKNKLNSQ